MSAIGIYSATAVERSSQLTGTAATEPDVWWGAGGIDALIWWGIALTVAGCCSTYWSTSRCRAGI